MGINNRSTGCFPRKGRSVSNQTGRRISVYKGNYCKGARIDIKTGHYSAKTPWSFKSMSVWGP